MIERHGEQRVLVGLGGVGRRVAALLAAPAGRPRGRRLVAPPRAPGAALGEWRREPKTASSPPRSTRRSPTRRTSPSSRPPRACGTSARHLRLRRRRPHVITTAEEAAQPWAIDAELADALDAAARARGVTVLGAGVNPGFVFDALVLTLAGAACAGRPRGGGARRRPRPLQPHRAAARRHRPHARELRRGPRRRRDHGPHRLPAVDAGRRPRPGPATSSASSRRSSRR